MPAKVVALAKREPSPTVVRALRAALARAEVGELTAVSIAAVKAGGGTCGFDSHTSAADAGAIIGALVMNAVHLAMDCIASSTQGPLPDASPAGATPEGDDSTETTADDPLP